MGIYHVPMVYIMYVVSFLFHFLLTHVGKLGGKDLELRSPFPPPGRVIGGEELDATTVEGVGLAPRGRLMVQFR